MGKSPNDQNTMIVLYIAKLILSLVCKYIKQLHPKKGGIIMTQMGLEYMKHRETARHNVSDEGIRQAGNVISKQDADTRQYVASFKPQEVQISSRQADASMSQADTAKGRLGLDTAYRERETVAKETTSGAAKSQADTAANRYSLDELHRERETQAKEETATAQSSNAMSNALNARARFKELDHRQLTDFLNLLDSGTSAELAIRQLNQGEVNRLQETVAGINKILQDLVSFGIKVG